MKKTGRLTQFLKKRKKTVLGVLLLAITLLIGGVAIYNAPIINISEECVALAPSVKTTTADFYISSSNNIKTHFSLRTLMSLKHVGIGKVQSPRTYYNDAERVASMIVTEPSYFSTLAENQRVEWRSSFCLWGRWKIIGVVVTDSEIIPSPENKLPTEDDTSTDNTVTEDSSSSDAATDDNMTGDIPIDDSSSVDNNTQEVPKDNNSSVNNNTQEVPKDNNSSVDNNTQEVPKDNNSSVNNNTQEVPKDNNTTPEQETGTNFSTVASMIAAPLLEGSIVTTNGYYSSNDGGAAKYLITADSKLTNNNSTVIQLDNGLFAILQVENNQVTVEQYGAYGDGVHDDVAAIQAAFDSDYTVLFTENKTYKISSNGLSIRNDVILNGNNATLLIDDSYAPKNTDFSNRVIRSNLKGTELMSFSNLNIEVTMSDGKYDPTNYFCVMQPTFIDSVSLDNVNITVNESFNQITNFWMDHGCKSLSIKNCTFVNNTTYKEGGIIFLNSATDKFHGRYNSFDSVIIDNCTFNGTCGDEAIAIWGENDITASISNTVVNWHRVGSGSSRPINISTHADCGTTYNVNFKECQFNCSGTTANNSECDSFIGIGTKYPSNIINVTFDSCNITANVRDALIKSAQLINSPELITTFDFLKQNLDLQFNACNITCDRPITGNNSVICPSTTVMTWATDCSFNNCTIESKYAFAYLECYPVNVYYAPKISVTNSEVTVNEPSAFIFKSNHGAVCSLKIDNVNITAPNITDYCTYRYQTTPAPKMTQQNTNAATETIQNIYINGSQIN